MSGLMGRLHLAGLAVVVRLFGTDSGWITWIRNRWSGPLPDRIYRYLQEHAQKGDPESVTRTLDRFAREEQWTYFVGDDKGPIMQNIVQEVKPLVCLELGSFIGYSAIAAARCLPDGARYYCVEPDETRVAVLRKVVEFAGLQETIHAIQGYSNEVIPTLKKELGIDGFDYVFIDHIKPMYKSDLLLLEENGLLKTGTVIVADNVIYPGAPDYLEYVRKSPKYTSTHFKSNLEYYPNVEDGLEKSIYIGDDGHSDT